MVEGLRTLDLGLLGLSSTEDATFLVVLVVLVALVVLVVLVVGVEPDLALVPAVFARDVFLTVAVAPSLEAEEARFEVFLAIVGPVYQK